jgi:two-component system nitrogen regulation response regulator NtrX
MGQDILIVDDEADIRDLVAGILSDEGYSPRVASDGTSALSSIKFRQPNLVILDVWLGDGERDGIKILEIIKRDHPHVPVIMMSGHGTIETAVAAIKRGAYDFIEKPFESDRLLLVIQRALETAKLKRENAELTLKAGTVDLLGTSSMMVQIRQMIDRIAPTNSRVFISGEAGVGKEVVARKIHQLSRRAEFPFVIINCATLHPDRIEAELFGTEIMGLPPSVPRKIGLLEQAHGGTLYFDEIVDLPLPTQAKLVRVLHDNNFSRLGDSQKIDVDVRVIASTATNISHMIQAGHFREDLFYRLNVAPLEVPLLIDRITDIPELITYFMAQISAQHGRPPRILSEEAMVVLQSYQWPGNVRQLKNLIEWIVIMAPGDTKDPITINMLPPEIRSDVAIPTAGGNPNVVGMPLREAREAFERDYLTAQVTRFGGNISKTARFIGMERSALHRKMKALGVHEGRPEEVEEDINSFPDEIDVCIA